MQALEVHYVLDPEAKCWTATIPEVPPVVTQGKTLGEVHAGVRAALKLVEPAFVARKQVAAVTMADDLMDAFRLTPSALELVRREVELRLESLELDVHLQHVTTYAANTLTHQERLSAREAGTLLGVSGQHVHQLSKLGRAM